MQPSCESEVLNSSGLINVYRCFKIISVSAMGIFQNEHSIALKPVKNTVADKEHQPGQVYCPDNEYSGYKQEQWMKLQKKKRMCRLMGLLAAILAVTVTISVVALEMAKGGQGHGGGEGVNTTTTSSGAKGADGSKVNMTGHKGATTKQRIPLETSSVVPTQNITPTAVHYSTSPTSTIEKVDMPSIINMNTSITANVSMSQDDASTMPIGINTTAHLKVDIAPTAMNITTPTEVKVSKTTVTNFSSTTTAVMHTSSNNTLYKTQAPDSVLTTSTLPTTRLMTTSTIPNIGSTTKPSNTKAIAAFTPSKTEAPTILPTAVSTALPTNMPANVFATMHTTTIKPTIEPTAESTATRTAKPTSKPRAESTVKPTDKPTDKPTSMATTEYPTKRKPTSIISAIHSTTSSGVPAILDLEADNEGGDTGSGDGEGGDATNVPTTARSCWFC